jgi:hypothetical protein
MWYLMVETGEARESIDLRKATKYFLAVDSSGNPCGPPILWGTMIFGGPNDKHEERYASREDAFAGHEKALARASGKPR